MTIERGVETVAGLVPVALATEATLMPAAESWIERLGVAAVLVVVGWFLLTWFMRQSDKKDDTMRQMQAAHVEQMAMLADTHAKAQRENTDLLMREMQTNRTEMQANRAVQQQVSVALERLSTVIERQSYSGRHE